MKLGLMMFATDQSILPQDLAREAEVRGFESLFFPEKTHLPVSRKTPWAGGELPEHYKRTQDLFVALAAAAAVTKTLRVGTGICLVAARDPIILAKEVATLDLISGGRFIFGVGYGWNVEEMEDHGIEFSNVAGIMRDKVKAMKRLWCDETASYDGEYVRFAPAWSWPKPVQRPHPPIIMGSRAGRSIFEDIANYADGWMPIEAWGGTVERIGDLRRAFEAVGRDPQTAQISIFASAGDPNMLESYARCGVDRVILALPLEGPESVIPVLDKYAKLIARFDER